MTALPRGRPEKSRRVRHVVAALVAAALALGGVAAWLAHRGHAREPQTPHAVEIPGLNLGEIPDPDPQVIRAVADARDQVSRAPGSARAWGRLGILLRANGGSPDASNGCFAEAERLDPRDPRWPYLQGTDFQRADRRLAVAKLRRSVELCGNTPDAPRLRLADLLLALGDAGAAEREYRAVLSADPGNARARLGLGRIAFERRDTRAVLAELGAAAEDPRTRRAAELLLAQLFQRLKRPDDAAQALRIAAESPPEGEWPDPYLQEVRGAETGRKAGITRAARLLAGGRPRAASDAAREVLRVYPDSAQALFLDGVACNASGDYTAAESALRSALKHGPGAGETYYHLAVALRGQGRVAESVAALNECIARKPDFAEAHLLLGETLETDHPEEAARAFRRAIACEPSRADGHRELGKLLARAGETDEAVRELEDALRLRPNDAEASAALANLRRAIPDGGPPKTNASGG